MKKTFYSHGKLLLTAEYLVLDGAVALAIPTKKGQSLTVKENKTNIIHWKSLDVNQHCWFEARLCLENNIIVNSNIEKESLDYSKLSEEYHTTVVTLLEILNTAKNLNPQFLSENNGYEVQTILEFPKNWGLGSSSTLINNIAEWSGVHAFQLLEKSFGGSGYDIACAQQDATILYKKQPNQQPLIKKLLFDPPFKKNLFFVHLNQKQNSKESIKHYRSLSVQNFEHAKCSIDKITEALLICKELSEFEQLITLHEYIISDIIKMETVQSRLFSDYSGVIKSLGGWGGDFVLATGTTDAMEYFKNKGFKTIVPYEDMVF